MTLRVFLSLRTPLIFPKAAFWLKLRGKDRAAASTCAARSGLATRNPALQIVHGWSVVHRQRLVADLAFVVCEIEPAS